MALVGTVCSDYTLFHDQISEGKIKTYENYSHTYFRR